MLIKALIDFGGQYAMREGDVAELPENAVTSQLIDDGYIVATAEEAGTEDVDETDAEEAGTEEDESDDERRKDGQKNTRAKGRPKK